MQHAWCGKHYHGARIVHVGLVKWLDVLEVKHVAVNKGATDLLIGPCDEHAIVLVGLSEERGAFIIYEFSLNFACLVIRHSF